MTTLERIVQLWGLSLNGQRSPIEIPNVGRDDLATLFHQLGFKVGAEVGVETGLYSQILCQRNPGLHLFAVDPWQAYRGYREHVIQADQDRLYEKAKARLSSFDCELVRKFSVDAAKDFEDGALDFAYLDGNHEFSHVVNDLTSWAPKVRKGGIIAGHDYWQIVGRVRDLVHVMPAVWGYTQAWGIAPWFVLGTKAIVEGQTRDKPRSWMWVR